MSDTSEWTPEQWQSFKVWLENLMYDGVVEVIFTKADGSTRTMQATKRAALINELKPAESAVTSDRTNTNGDKPRKRPKLSEEAKRENILVWDVDLGDWRTLKVKKIQNILTLILKYDYKEQGSDGRLWPGAY